jgi:putative spermidine/putrescine transport system permease protein
MIGGGRVPTISTLVYQLGLASTNFPFAASLSIAGLIFTAGALMILGLGTRRLKKLGAN